jgi:hypothetical protein
MFVANFEDGSSVSSKQMYWDDIPKGKRISGLQIVHPHLPKLYITLNKLHTYFYMQEAIQTFQGSGFPSIVAEVIGGHDLKLGIVQEVRLSYMGNVTFKTYPLERFKYSPQILRDGMENGLHPTVEVGDEARLSV